MKIATFITALALTTAGIAEEDKLLDRIGDLGKASPTRSKASGSRSAAAYGSSIRIVVASESTILPGAFRDYGEIPADFSGAEDVAVSISAPDSNLSGTTILVAWAAPNEYFVVTNKIQGSTLVTNLSGGARVPVYGSALRIIVANDGKEPITIRQLAAYAFVH